jgi:hypothetical protein
MGALLIRQMGWGVFYITPVWCRHACLFDDFVAGSMMFPYGCFRYPSVCSGTCFALHAVHACAVGQFASYTCISTLVACMLLIGVPD